MPAIDESPPIPFQFGVLKGLAVNDSGMKGANGIVAQLPAERLLFVMSLTQAAEKGGLRTASMLADTCLLAHFS